MRLQLAALALTLGVAPAARAQVADQAPGEGDVQSAVAMYADSDRTTIVTSVVDARVRLPVAVGVAAHALVDAVSSASVDVISAATARFTENRVELGARAQLGLSRSTEASVGYTHSGENDWRSHAIELGGSRELAHQNVRLTLQYGFTRNHVGRAHDTGFDQQLDVHGAQLGFAQVLDRRTLATVAYTVSHARGYQGSPYRFITTMDGFSAPESPPEARTRHAVALRVLRALGRGGVLDATYRFYLDDWGILSNTAELAYTQDLTARLALRLRARGYRQRHAAFYQERYAMAMRYMTVDRELSTFWDGAAGVKLGWRGERWELEAKLDGLVYRFDDYARLRGRVAIVSAGGATWRW